MKRYLTLVLIGAFMNVANVSAQTSDTPSDKKGRQVTVYSSHEFTLTDITGFSVVNERLNGMPLPAPRHHIRGLYTPVPAPCPKEMLCTAVMPVSKPASVILREWEFAADGIQDRMLNICRRTIENARPDAVVKLKGKVTIDSSGNSSLVYLQSITSCVVQYPRQGV
jgi:hypothetical protein